MELQVNTQEQKPKAKQVASTVVNGMEVIQYESGAVGFKVPGFRGYASIGKRQAQVLRSNPGAILEFLLSPEFDALYESKEEKLVKLMREETEAYVAKGLSQEEAAMLAHRKAKLAGLCK
jgi:hypothetical protein